LAAVVTPYIVGAVLGVIAAALGWRPGARLVLGVLAVLAFLWFVAQLA
jgi:hypothetical protein